jgi:mxaD protein
VKSARAEIDIAKPSDAVWAVVSDFGGLANWVPVIDSCLLHGADRVVVTERGAVTERLESSDEDRRVLVYRIVEGHPATFHRATITVIPSNNDSHVTWEVELEPDELAGPMQQAYQGFLQALKTYVGG